MVANTLSQSLADAVPLTRAADFIPGRPHVATLWRWATKGVRGITLQTAIVGGRRMVTPAALEQFLLALNAGTPAARKVVDADASRRATEANNALSALGY